MRVKRYEGLFILNGNLTSTGKDDGVTVALDKISKEIEAAGGKIEGTQKMDKRNFSRVADKKFNSGFYVNVLFSFPGAALAALKHKFALNDDIFRVLVTIAPPPKEEKAKSL
jgi:ribosomal protein S6